jgi:hypothetical protein
MCPTEKQRRRCRNCLPRIDPGSPLNVLAAIIRFAEDLSQFRAFGKANVSPQAFRE